MSIPFAVTTAEMVETIVLCLLRKTQWAASGRFGSISRLNAFSYIVECEGKSFAVVNTAEGWQVGCNGRIGRARELIEAARLSLNPA